MAKATVNTETIVKGVTLELSKDEAEFLATVMYKTASQDYISNKISTALDDAGISHFRWTNEPNGFRWSRK